MKTEMSKNKIDKIQIVQWDEISKASKQLFLKAFDLEKDSEGFVTKNGVRVIDKYINKLIKYDNVALLPTNSDEPIVIDGNPLSISSYLEEFESNDLDKTVNIQEEKHLSSERK